jgi:hypothetical protein
MLWHSAAYIMFICNIRHAPRRRPLHRRVNGVLLYHLGGFLKSITIRSRGVSTWSWATWTKATGWLVHLHSG